MPVARRRFYSGWTRGCRNARLGDRIPHDFRRTAVRNLVQTAGVSEKVAMELTRHLTRSVLDRYFITTPKDREDAVSRLAKTVPERDVLPLVDPNRTPKASGE